MVAGFAGGFALLLVLQKAFKLTGGNSILWAIPCVFAGFLVYNWLKPKSSN